MKYYILVFALAAPVLHAAQSPARKCYLPAPMAFRKKPTEMPEYETISQQLGKAVKRVNPALNDELFLAITTNNVVTVRQLLQGREIPDVNAIEPNSGISALGEAIYRGTFPSSSSPKSLRIFQLLVEAGANVNIHSRDLHNTPLHQAVVWNPEAVSLLLQVGALVDIKDQAGRTPLMYAAYSGLYPESIKSLLNAGADINLKDNHGKTAYDQARSYFTRQLLRDYAKLQSQEHIKSAHSAIKKTVEAPIAQKTTGMHDIATIVYGYHRPVPPAKIPVPPAKISEELLRQMQQDDIRENSWTAKLKRLGTSLGGVVWGIIEE